MSIGYFAGILRSSFRLDNQCLRSSHHSGGAESYITSIHEATEAEFSKNLVEITLSEQETESLDEDDQVTIVKCKQEKKHNSNEKKRTTNNRNGAEERKRIPLTQNQQRCHQALPLYRIRLRDALPVVPHGILTFHCAFPFPHTVCQQCNHWISTLTVHGAWTNIRAFFWGWS